MFLSLFYYYYFSCDLNNFPKILNFERVATLWCSGHPTEDLTQGCVCVCVCVCVCTHSVMSDSCNFMDGSLPGSSVHGLFQVRILEWVAISFSTGSSQLRDQSCMSCISCLGRWILYHCGAWKATSHTESTKKMPVMINPGIRHRLKKSILKMKYFQFKLLLCETSKFWWTEKLHVIFYFNHI